MSSRAHIGSEPRTAFGVLCALPEELGSLGEHRVGQLDVLGLELLELDLDGQPALAVVSGIGKVAAARAAAALIVSGATRALFVVGTCGGLKRELTPGTLVHCTRALQVDLAVRAGREVHSDPRLRAAWRALEPGPEGSFLTADRPVLSWWRRARLAGAFAGPVVAEMETASAAAVAHAAGVPWAALRAVSDRAGHLGAAEFRLHLRNQAPRAADSVLRLVAALGRAALERAGVVPPPSAP